MDELIASRNEIADTYSRTGEFIGDTPSTHHTHQRRNISFEMFGQGNELLANDVPRFISLPYDENWYSSYSITYNHELAQVMSVLASSAYDEQTAWNNFNLMGCNLHKSRQFYPTSGDYDDNINRVAYSFGLDDSDPSMPIVYILIRGTTGNVEWKSNFELSDMVASSEHTGFRTAEAFLFADLTSWIRNVAKVNLSKTRFVITGHSRGGPVANLLGAHLDDGALSDATGQSSTAHTFVYTYASPSVTLDRHASSSWQYDNIFNIVNPQDFVPRVPLALWGSRRYGVTKVLLSQSNTSPQHYQTQLARMQEQFSRVTSGQTYYPYRGGDLPIVNMQNAFYGATHSVRAYNTEWLSYFDEKGGVATNYTMSEVLQTIGNDLLGHRGYPISEPSPMPTGRALIVLLQTRPKFAARLGSILWEEGLAEIIQRIDEQNDNIPIAKPFVHAHAQETYIAWMLSGSESEVFGDEYRGARIACPVDVRVYDAADDSLVCEIIDDVVNEDVMATGLAAMVIGTDKYIDIPSDGQYRFEITPRKSGEMDVTLTDYSADGIAESKVAYTALSLEAGASYDAQVLEDMDGSLTAAEEIELTKDEALVEANVVAANAEAVDEVSVTVSVASGDGMTEGNIQVMPGEKVTIIAIPAEGANFLGWYDGDNLVSEDATYEFRPQESVELSARFTNSIAMAVVDDIPSQPYTGEAVLPQISLTHHGETVPSNAYEMSSDDNIYPGTAHVTLTAKPNSGFTGQLTIEFEISWPFKDIDGETFHVNDVLWMTSSGITTGYPDNTFRPYDTVARCDMAAFLFRLAKKGGVVDDSWQASSAQQKAFSDVTSSTPHCREVWWLASTGISKGWKVGSKYEFRPYATVARQDMAAFLFRLAKLANKGGASDSWQASDSSKTRFRDVSATAPDNHHDEVWWLAETGVSAGWDVGGGKYEFRGLQDVARCDMAAFLHRMDGLE